MLIRTLPKHLPRLFCRINLTIQVIVKRIEDPDDDFKSTVPIFKSCTKCMGSRGIIHDRTPLLQPSFLYIDDLPTERRFDS